MAARLLVLWCFSVAAVSMSENGFEFAIYRKWFNPGCGENGTEAVLSCEPTQTCYQQCGGPEGGCFSHKVSCYLERPSC